MPAGKPRKFEEKQLLELWTEFNADIRDGGFTTIPSQTAFCRYLRAKFGDCDRKTIYNSINKYFPNLKKEFERIQADTIAEGAMLGKYQTTMAIFALKNWCRWCDNPALQEAIDEREVRIIDDIK